MSGCFVVIVEDFKQGAVLEIMEESSVSSQGPQISSQEMDNPEASPSGALLVHNSWTSDILGHLYRMCSDGQFCDMSLVSSDKENLPCHSTVIVAASGYFNRVLLSLNQTFVNAQAVIHLGIESKYLRQILSFIYTGQVSVQLEDMGALKQTAAFLEIPVLQKLCQEHGVPCASSDDIQKLPAEEESGTVVKQREDAEKLYDHAPIILSDVLEQVDFQIEAQEPSDSPHNETVNTSSGPGVASEHMEQPTTETDLPFVCEHKGCNSRFRRKDTLMVHSRIHSGIRPYRCQYCDKAYKQRAHLSEHVRRHTGEKPYECQTCSRRFSSFSFFSRHRASHVGAILTGATGQKDGRPGFQCQFCEKIIFSKVHHVAHENVHRGIFPHKCNACEETFESRSKAYNHEAVVHNMHKCINCPFCSKTFINKGHFKEHLRGHTGDKPFFCQESGCTKKYARKKDLMHHLRRVHSQSGPKRYHCMLCDKSYAEQRNLTDHMRAHTGEEPYQCHMCKSTFKSHSAYIRHSKKHKAETEELSCTICAKTFTRSDTLKTHIKKVHDVHSAKFPCTLCQTGFQQKVYLQKHLLQKHLLEAHSQTSEDNTNITNSSRPDHNAQDSMHDQATVKEQMKVELIVESIPVERNESTTLDAAD